MYADQIAALTAANTQGLLSGPYMGVDPPGLPAGKLVWPAHMQGVTNTTTVAVTAARYYITDWFFTGKQTFAGAMFQQGGVGDSGKKVKIAFFSITAGGATSSLAKSFGEYTLDASATTKQLASAWTPARGWYRGMFVCDGAGTFRGMTPVRNLSGAGAVINQPLNNMLGAAIADAFGVENGGGYYCGDYVGGTYANFPEATGLAMTNSIFTSTGNAVVFPAFAPYA